MSTFAKDDDAGRFANGVSNRDLRMQSDPPERNSRFKPEQFPAPIGELLGLKVIQPEKGVAIVEFEADEGYANPAGTLHGGVWCDIADAAMGFAYRSTLADDESLTTIELKINFLRPVWKAKLRAEARVVRAGTFVGLLECDVVDNSQL